MRKTIHLKPVRHEAPQCLSYDDESLVQAFERQVRVHRAHTEPFRITPLEDRADGAFRVEGESGAAHHVDIVDQSASYDTCSCPDFLTNGLATCKHLEAVRRMLNGPRRFSFRKLPKTPSVTTLTVKANGRLELMAVAPNGALRAWDSALFSGGSAPSPGRSAKTGRVTHASARAFEILAGTEAIRARARSLQAAAAASKLAVDVLKVPLFPYQRDGVIHLAAQGRALLADDMGLGKTVQAIAACEVLRARGEARRILIVTPASLKHQWAKEIERLTGDRAVVVGGAVAERHAAFSSDAPYVILNYELTWRDLRLVQNLQADILVIDEAQRAKNFRTKTATTLRAIPSRFLFVLTGTPIENRLDDLYSLMQLIEPNVLGPLWRYNLDFHQQTDRGKITGYKNLSDLRSRLSNHVLRRRKEEVLLQLPALTEQTRYTRLSPDQEDLESSLRGSAARLLAQAERRPLTKKEQERLMMLLLKARQACNALELADPKSPTKASPKLDEFEAVISEIASQGNSKAIVFSEWTEMLRLAAARLDRLGIRYLTLHGGIPTDKRPALLDRFRDDADCQVLLSTDAGGVGLNLQAASYVVHLDLPWNPGKLDQRIARAHRLGQTRGVSVTYLCSETGIERGIEGTLEGKRAIRGAALDASADIEEMDAPSFSMFMKQMREVMNELDDDMSDEQEEESTFREENGASASLEGASMMASGHPERVQGPPSLPEPAPSSRFASERLRLAEVVLEAGFPADAVRAAYDALAGSLRGLLPEPIAPEHAVLVAEIYRQLLPLGRVPRTVHGVLAKVHDLSLLGAHGVAVDAELAREAVREANEWVARITAS